MAAVLGIDAAWTEKNDSGFALAEKIGGRWRLSAAASNIRRFAAACGLDGEAETKAGPAFAIVCAERILGDRLPDLIAVDMPLSRKDITGRRASDIEVSRRFGAAKCATHSPSEDRPGKVSAKLRRACEARGYTLATAQPLGAALSLAEVYPHPALLRLMAVPERFPYKVNKTNTYWRGAPSDARLANVKKSLGAIVANLELRIAGVAERVGEEISVAEGFSALKPVEDMIDAIIAAWVGITILEGGAEPIGDADSAIWIPNVLKPAAGQAGAAR